MTSKHSIRTFTILILTQTFSLIGSRMTGLAIGIKVFNDTQAVTPLALVGFFSIVPRLLVTGVAGVLADRWDRRKVMIAGDVGEAIGTFVLLLSFATGTFELWILYVVVIWQATFSMFQGPAFQASITQLVPDEMRDRANAIQQITGPTAGFIAPILAGFLFVLIGATGVMVIDLSTFIVAIAVVAAVHIPRPAETAEGQEAKGSVWREALSGFKMLWKLRLLFYLIIFATALNFFFNMTLIMLTPYILLLTDSEEMLGTLLALMSLGTVVGGVIMSVWKFNVSRMHIAFPALIVQAVFLVLLGVMRAPVTLGIAMFLLLLPNPMANAPLMSLIQAKTPPDMQGRIFAAIMQLAMLATPLGFLFAGPLADGVLEPAVGGEAWSLVEPIVGSQPGSGIGLLMVISGSICTILGMILYAWPRMRNIERELPDYEPVAVAAPAEDEAMISTAEPVVS